MITTEESVTGKVYVWAVPRSSYAIERSEDKRPFSYEIKSEDYHYTTGAVKVHECTVTVKMPGGINLIAKAIETLEDAKVKARVEYMDRIKALEEQISNLKLLPPPEPRVAVAEGEFIPAGHSDEFGNDTPF